MFRQPGRCLALAFAFVFGLLPSLCRPALGGSAEAGSTWAVIIAVQKHDHPRFNLDFTNNDATKLKEILVQRGGVLSNQILMLTDDSPVERWPTVGNLQRELEAFLKRVQPRDRLIVFFSGHGVTNGQETCLVTRDFDPAAAKTGLPTSQLGKALSACAARVKLVILDCCHAGGVKDTDSPSLPPEALAKSISRDRVDGCIVLASCAVRVAGRILPELVVQIGHSERLAMYIFSPDAGWCLPAPRTVARLFQERGEQLYGEGQVHVSLLLDEQATRDGIRQALAEVASKAQQQDAFLLAVSAHGTMLGQRYYFVTHEVQTRAGKLVEDEIRDQCLPGDQLDDWITAVPALRRVVVYDTCHSGAAISISRTARSSFEYQKELESMSRRQGSFLIAAASAGEEAHPIRDLGHGALTYTLLAGLGAVDKGPLQGRTASASQDGKLVGVRDWFSFAQDQVPALTKVYLGREQFVSFVSGQSDFPILPLDQRP